MAQPPEIDPNKLDFSQFHPLDHYLWEPYCRELYGGPLNHAQLWWEYKATHWLHEKTLCRIGLHTYTETWKREQDGTYDEWLSCVYCWKDKE